MLQRVAIFGKDDNAKTRNAVQTLISEFNRRGIGILINQRPDGTDAGYKGDIEVFSDVSSLQNLPGLILSVGGDGTFLETVLRVKDLGIPVAGVNTGRMGFLANIPNEDLGKSVDQLCNNEYELISRSMLEISHPTDLFEGESAVALNEITMQKSNVSMITIHQYVDDEFLNTY